MEDKPLDLNVLLKGLVEIIGGANALAMQFERLARDMGLAEGATTVMFLSGIKNILRGLPDKTFVDKNARLAMVDAVQDALDDAIEAEEKMEENEEGGNS
jgi:type III secretion protein W